LDSNLLELFAQRHERMVAVRRIHFLIRTNRR
jgi:hypothetical protein